jgi:hypothetical protein
MLFSATEPDWAKVVSTCFPLAELRPPPSTSQIEEAGSALGRPLPDELVALLKISDGLTVESVSLIFPLTELVDTNRDYRTNGARSDCMPFDHLLFFGSEANGDQFGFPISQEGDYMGPVFAWSHETDCREFFAYSLLDFFLRYRAYAGDLDCSADTNAPLHSWWQFWRK